MGNLEEGSGCGETDRINKFESQGNLHKYPSFGSQLPKDFRYRNNSELKKYDAGIRNQKQSETI